MVNERLYWIKIGIFLTNNLLYTYSKYNNEHVLSAESFKESTKLHIIIQNKH